MTVAGHVYKNLRRNREHDLARIRLAQLLREGSLCLVLGSGASACAALPIWRDLAERCWARTGTDGENTVGLMEMLRRLEISRRSAGDEWRRVVHDSLYENVSYSSEVIREPLLIAIGALVMGSSRGTVSDVVTYNFDDLLEWYLRLHGFTSQSIGQLPYLEQTVDVRVYHPHGFLPKDRENKWTHRIVFDYKSYLEAFGQGESQWGHRIRTILASRVALFVGTSLTDPLLESVVADVQGEIDGEREIGYLLGREDFLSGDTVETLFDRGIVPLSFSDFDQMPDFLLGVCQEACA